VLVVNEVTPEGDPEDWFEIVNAGDEVLVLSDYSYAEEVFGAGLSAPFPEGVDLAPGERHVQLVIEEEAGFRLGSDEELGIRDSDGGFVDGIDWAEGEAPEGWSYARVPDVEGAFRPSHHPSPGAPNTP
jgi:hypothetical protein